MTTTFEFPLPLVPDHPALAGHFPNLPIYPGVVLLDQLISALEDECGAPVRTLQVVKFLAPVRPGTAITARAERGGNSVRFDLIADDGTRVATGTLQLQESGA
jgi:3-hydroxyacyl-[acyl-carrier-protein] dehydratase